MVNKGQRWLDSHQLAVKVRGARTARETVKDGQRGKANRGSQRGEMDQSAWREEW